MQPISHLAITGAGLVTAAGLGRGPTVQALRAPRGGVAPIHLSPAPPTCAGLAPGLFRPGPEDAGLDPAAALLLEAARQAMDEAAPPPALRERCATLLSTPKAGVLAAAALYPEFLRRGPAAVPADFLLHLLPGRAGRIAAARWGLCGPEMAVAAACNSGIAALELACDLIARGAAGCALVGCGESSVTPVMLCSLERMGVLCPGADPAAFRPFDERRSGFFPGEGAAALFVEPLEAALRRGTRPLAVVAAAQARNEAFHGVAQNPDPRPLARWLAGLLQGAGLPPSRVGYVNAHGSGTPGNDTLELDLVRAVFGAHAREGLRMSSTKPFTGHVLSASGIVELALSVAALENDLVPPNLHLQNPLPGATPLVTPIPVEGSGLRAVLNLNFGFGSSVGAAVLVKPVL